VTISNRASVASLRSLVSRAGLVISLLIALVFPLLFAVHSYLHHAEVLSFKARLNGDRVAKYIYSHERLWEYQHVRLSDIIQLPDDGGEPIRQRIRNREGKILVEQGAALNGPLLSRNAPLLVRDALLGHVEVEISLTNPIMELGVVTLASFLLGAAAYLALRVFPMRALDRTVGELERQNFRFDTALNNMGHGLSMFDREQRLVVCNERYRQLYNLPAELCEPGSTWRQMAEYRSRHEARPPDTPDDYLRRLVDFQAEDKECTSVFEMADSRVVAMRRNPMVDGGWVAAHEDVTEQRHAAARIAYLAHHDTLTDLPNRLLLRERLREALRHVARGESLALLCLDLDRFKEINDTLGHPVGDALLKQAAERMRSCVREVDVVARMGGDEFVIVQVGVAQPEGATALAARIIEELSTPYQVLGHHATVGTSVGVALAPLDGNDADHLLKSADLALYQAKADGRGVCRFFEAQMNERVQARRQLELDLRRALANGEFELHYQPLLSLASNEVNGFEALLRWNHPTRGMVSPAEFVPLAEEIGVICSIGEWVLRQACAEAANWPENIKVAVNLSPVQFKVPGLVTSVLSALSASGLPANRLELEITESVLLESTESALSMLHQMRSLGVSIAMDDFGTGYSSLSYLQSFPFDKIKVDRSFIMDLGLTTGSVAVLRAVASLGSSLCVITTAEGVETEEQLMAVRAEGISQIQGYLVSPPKPAGEVLKLIAANLAQPKKKVSAA
jgi:diguanylate cyclase (GGDEF)-like protein